VLIIIGYISGIMHKIISSRDILILLYLVNLSMIIADLDLYLRYSNKEQRQSTRLNTWERVSTLFLPDLNRQRVIPSTQLSASPPHCKHRTDSVLGRIEGRCFSALC
jgi:hypothetical protein